MVENVVKRYGFLLILSITTLVPAACAPKEEPVTESPPAAPPITAAAQLNPTEGNQASGTIAFEQVDNQVRISGQISGLSPGPHGFHIHETGDCSAPDAGSAGGHFNPGNDRHGSPDDPEHHAGDLGNIQADEQGNASIDATVDYISLSEGDENNIIDRAVVVHQGPDDFSTQPDGAAGARLACGVIESR